MTGNEFREIRKQLGIERADFALLIGYTGSDRNNDFRIRKMENMELVPLHIARLVWLIELYFCEHNRNLPHWPETLRLEGESEPWM